VRSAGTAEEATRRTDSVIPTRPMVGPLISCVLRHVNRPTPYGDRATTGWGLKSVERQGPCSDQLGDDDE